MIIRVVKKIWQILDFFFFYVLKIIQANFQLSYQIITPGLKMKPGILKIPVNLSHDQAILLLINLISMTPGTFTMDLSPDKKHILVHALILSDENKIRNEIKILETKISNLFK